MSHYHRQLLRDQEHTNYPRLYVRFRPEADVGLFSFRAIRSPSRVTQQKVSMIAGLFWSVVCASIALMVAAFVRLFRERLTTVFDFLLIPAPLILWLALVIIGWKQKSLSNLVEPLIIVVLIPVIFSLRTYAVAYGTNHQRSLGAFSICVGLAVYFMPQFHCFPNRVNVCFGSEADVSYRPKADIALKIVKGATLWLPFYFAR